MVVFVVARTRCRWFPFLLAWALVACEATSPPRSTAPRYLVTANPIDIGFGARRLCVAVDPLDERGVWWWEPGGSGCADRSTGPGVFQADQAFVSRSGHAGPITLGFRVGTHSFTRPFVRVRLVVEDGQMWAIESGARVPIRRRSDLDVPEAAAER
jgi:hypothetical protein